MTHFCAAKRSTAQILSEAEELTSARRQRMTPQRRRTLEILLESRAALGAYDLLRQLAADGLGDKPANAYRALNFLVEQGLAHRIEGMNAFVACCHPAEDHTPVFMICKNCRVVAEAHDEAPAKGIEDAASQIGFSIERRVVEAVGLCRTCLAEPSA